MNNLTPHIHELEYLIEDDLRETLSNLNNASLRKITREAIKTIKEQKYHMQFQNVEIKKLRGRMEEVNRLTSKEWIEEE